MSDKLDELEQKRKELKAELEQIQVELDQDVVGVRSEVSRSFSPDRLIRKYPLPVLGASVLLGFLVGHQGGDREDRRKGSSDSAISDTLFTELKRLATQKALRFAGDYLEELLEGKIHGSKDSSARGEE